MPGLLTHLFVGIASALLVHLIHMKGKYSFAVFFGNILPDIPKFGLTALKQGTWHVFSIVQDPFYRAVDAVTYDVSNWFALGFFVFAVLLFLFHFHYIKEKTMEDYDLFYVYLLIGVFTHMVMDVFIIETSAWI